MAGSDSEANPPLKLTPVDPNAPSSLGNSAYSELRQRIVNGDLRAGERLREVELAALLGVSRTPVREAIKRLESEGFAAYVSSRGAIVAELTAEQAIELYAMREVLEGAAARFASQHASLAEVQLLSDLLAVQKDLDADPEEQSKLNRRFHQSIYRMAHNRYLLDILTKSHDYMVLLRKTTYHVPGRNQTAYHEHAAIVEAIKARDSNGAEEAARRHIREAQRIRMMLQFGS